MGCTSSVAVNGDTGSGSGSNKGAMGGRQSGANSSGGNQHHHDPSAGPSSPQIDISHFTMIRQIGMGGFAEVFVAQRNNGMRELVAIKRVDKLRVLRFKEVTTTTPRGEVKVQTKVRMSSTVWVERQVWPLLDSPFLVPLLHCFQDNKYLYFVMPLFGPGDLNMIQRHSGCMPDSAIRFYAAEIVLALEALHSQNIVFRDLKPHNVLMRPDGHICLSDFGLCASVPSNGDGISDIRGQVGTKGFQAPEIIRNTGHSYPIDFFALGVTLFRIATDTRPFNKSKTSFTHQIPILPVHRVLRPPDDPSLSRAAYTPLDLAQQYISHALALGLPPAQAAASAQRLAAHFVRTGGGFYDVLPPAAYAIVGSPNNYTSSSSSSNHGGGNNVGPSARRGTVNGTGAGGSGARGSPISHSTAVTTQQSPSPSASLAGTGSASHLAIAQSIQLAVAAGVGTPQPGEYVVSLAPELVDLIQQLMDIDPQYRLGTRNRLLRPANHYNACSAPGSMHPSTPRGGGGSGSRRDFGMSQGASPRIGALNSPEDPSNAEACSEMSNLRGGSRAANGRGGGRGGRDNSDDGAEASGGSESRDNNNGFGAGNGGGGPRKSVLAMRQGTLATTAGGGAADGNNKDKRVRHSPRQRGGRTPTQQQPGTPGNSGMRSPRQVFRGRDESGQWNSLHNGFAQIKAHPYFAGIDWDALADGRSRPPFVPQTNVSAIVQTFKQQLPEKARKDGVVPKSLTRQEQALFQVCTGPLFVNIICIMSSSLLYRCLELSFISCILTYSYLFIFLFVFAILPSSPGLRAQHGLLGGAGCSGAGGGGAGLQGARGRHLRRGHGRRRRRPAAGPTDGLREQQPQQQRRQRHAGGPGPGPGPQRGQRRRRRRRQKRPARQRDGREPGQHHHPVSARAGLLVCDVLCCVTEMSQSVHVRET